MFKQAAGLFLTLLLSLSAYAGSLVYENKENKMWIEIFDTPCTNKEILEQVMPKFKKDMKAGKAQFDKNKVEFCWTLDPKDPSFMILLDDQGEQASLPIAIFAKKKEDVI